MTSSRALAVAAALLLASCADDDAVTLTVDLRTDFVFGDDFLSVETLLADEAITSGTETRRVEATGLSSADFIAGHRVAELDGVGQGTRYLRVRLLDEDGALVVARDAIAELETDTTITVVVTRACTGVVCPGAGDPESATACVGGACVDPRCTPETPDFCGEPECEADAECPGSTGCVVATCSDGFCLEAPDDGMCGSGERCLGDGTCERGSMDSGVPDASPPDTSVVDSGMDTAADTLMLATNYCPDDALLREEMAVFLVRLIHGTDFEPPPASGTFDDVPAGSFYAPWIEQLQRDDVTNGCATDLYCPSDPVIRDIAAVFFVRATYGGSYMPPAATGTVFGDVSTSTPFADFIEQLARDGITTGCGGGDYCPTDALSRANLAIFLVRLDRGPSYTPPPAVGLFADVDPSRLEAPFIEQIARDGYTNGCAR